MTGLKALCKKLWRPCEQHSRPCRCGWGGAGGLAGQQELSRHHLAYFSGKDCHVVVTLTGRGSPLDTPWKKPGAVQLGSAFVGGGEEAPGQSEWLGKRRRRRRCGQGWDGGNTAGDAAALGMHAPRSICLPCSREATATRQASKQRPERMVRLMVATAAAAVAAGGLSSEQHRPRSFLARAAPNKDCLEWVQQARRGSKPVSALLSSCRLWAPVGMGDLHCRLLE